MFEQAFKNIDDVLWKEAGCTTELDYTEQTSWLLFLKYLDALEQDRADEAALAGKRYTYILDKPYRWDTWAAPRGKDGKLDHNTALTGDDLCDFVNRKLFPYLHNFKVKAIGPQTIDYKIGEIKNKIQSGYNLREIIDHTHELRNRTPNRRGRAKRQRPRRLWRRGNQSPRQKADRRVRQRFCFEQSCLYAELLPALPVSLADFPISDWKIGICEELQSATGKSEIAQSLIGQLANSKTEPRPFTLSWTHYIFLLGIKNPDERSFYEIEATREDWTVRELKRQFDSSLYERLALSRNKKGIRKLARAGHTVGHAKDLLKEPLVLEFLGLSEQAQYSESDLETAIINRIEHFLLELGKGFLFEARQKRFTVDGDHFFVDLVFYNRLLRCYVLVDLKIGSLTHQDLGQMQMYVNHFDRSIKTKDENSTIGIILCKKKSESLVKITLPRDANIHAREYQLYLPSKEKLQEWAVEARRE